jgi:hypothetical protein
MKSIVHVASLHNLAIKMVFTQSLTEMSTGDVLNFKEYLRAF